MVKRRDVIMLGLAARLLAACGGGGTGSSNGPGPGATLDAEDVSASSIPDDDWALASPQSQGISATAIQGMHARMQTIWQMRSVLVVRNGMLVHESYYGAAKSSDLQHIRSSTKSVSSMLIGQAIRDGKIGSTAATMRQLLPKELASIPNSTAGDVTLQQVLQMRSGRAFIEDNRIQEIAQAPNLAQMALALPASGGNAWNYDSATSHLLSPILANAWGDKDALSVATRTLFEPLGIRQVGWTRDGSGANYGSNGLKMRSRDFMKLAWMALDGGQWQGKSIVPAAWLAESMTAHQLWVRTTPVRVEDGYGYLWWMAEIGGRKAWLARGFGGQLAILIPSLRLAVVTTAHWNRPYTEGGATASTIESFVSEFVATLTPA